MASASSSSSSRTFEFEQVSLNNVARIEVVKVPTPAMEADSLGGQVNMISRNAFEAPKREFKYRVYVNAPGDYLSLSRSPGPGDFSTRKVRPGYDFSYADPVSDNFGFVINYLNSEAFTPQAYIIQQWDTAGAVATPDNPYLRYFNVRDGPKLSFRESGSLKIDFRITPKTIVSINGQVNDYSTTFFNREIRWETGVNSHSPAFTEGSGNGRFRHQLNTREKTGRTYHGDVRLSNHPSIIKAQYAGRQEQSGGYDGFYPSLHLTYEATPDLVIRLAYARTLGRPDINLLAPATRYDNQGEAAEDGGPPQPTIFIANPDLVSYTSDNFDLSVEYYFSTGGAVSAGIFYKKIKGFIDTQTQLLNAELADRYGIDQSYVSEGWLFQRTANVGDVTLKGIELSLMQDLTFVPDAWGNVSVFANATLISTSGDYGDSIGSNLVSSYVPGFIKETYNWGITYDKGALDIRLKWNYRGKQMRDTGDIRGFLADGSSAWNRFYDSRLTMDINIEYAFTRRFRLFLNGRNVLNEPTDQLRVTRSSPDHAILERREKFGPLWSLGLKGTF